MSLADLDLKFKYRSSQDKLSVDFFEPCIGQSNFYDRAAGYFSSNSLVEIAKGLESFIYKGGKIRIVANPYLTDADMKAIAKGYRAKEDTIIYNILREIQITAEQLQTDTLNIMAWLIAKGQLEIKIAYTESNSLYHEKFGIFRDFEGNAVAFSGSSNETAGGLINNFEKIDVYDQDHDQYRIDDMMNDFELLWKNQTPGLKIIEIPEAVKKTILSYKGQKPMKPSEKLELRDYQIEAIAALRNNGWSGILDMATGTGKTITSLSAMKEYAKENGRAFVILIVPFTHLVEQWEDECIKMGIKDITLCYGSKDSWKEKLQREIRHFNLKFTKLHVVITTYKSASMPEFLNNVEKIQKNGVLICDECHYLGSSSFRYMKLFNIHARIGLSATPERWWDEGGTAFLNDFFSGTVYQYSLEKAINEGKLTEYQYHPHVLPLTEDEIEQYRKLTKKIVAQYNYISLDEDKISSLNRKRALVLSKAESKIPYLIKLLKEKGTNNITNTIVYCAEKQVDILTSLLSSMGIRVHRFNSEVPTNERKNILKSFDKGDIQVLVAIKCLDEGVDIPSTRCAYFLSSTSNPREFVQRRGRILRTAKGKANAEIHDFIVLVDNGDQATFEMVAKKEFPRFAEFCNSAINKSEAKLAVYDMLSRYNLTDLMNKKPWDVYHEMKEKRENDNKQGVTDAFK